MKELIQSNHVSEPKINHYNFLYQDNVHLNFNHGNLFLKNHLLMFSLQTSTGICDINKFTNRSYKMNNRLQNFQEQHWPNTSANPKINLNSPYRYQPY